MISPALFSSASEDWATPRDLAAKLVAEFGITIDVCASASNAVVPIFWSKKQNALSKDWFGKCWMNPPYGRQIDVWVKKARDSANHCRATVVCLLPSRTDTRWWHDFVLAKDRYVDVEVRFLRGRLHFNESKNAAPFPSAVVIFKPIEVA